VVFASYFEQEENGKILKKKRSIGEGTRGFSSPIPRFSGSVLSIRSFAFSPFAFML
jgi:hypothetical protein